MLSVDQLTICAKPKGDTPLLKAISFSVESGEAVGLVGPSGCGKTTLLRAIAGLIDPLDGVVTLDSQTPKDMGWPSYRSRVSLVPQRPVVWDDTVSDNLLRPLAFDAVKTRYSSGDAQALLDQIGLADRLRDRATELSEGERQRVCLVRALLARPAFLLLDEPTSALDDDSVRAVESLLRKTMVQGPGVLVVTHDRAFADRFCSSVIDLADYLPTGGGVNHA